MADPWAVVKTEANDPWAVVSSQPAMPAPNSIGLANQALRGTGITVNAPVNYNIQTGNAMQVPSAVKRFVTAAGGAAASAVQSVPMISTVQGMPSILPEPQSPVAMAKGVGSLITDPLKRGIVEGDVAGALGEGSVKYPLAASAIEGGVRGVRGVTNAVVNGATAAPADSLVAALKPTGKVAPKLKTAIETATPDLQQIASTDSPKSIPELHGSLQKASLAYEAKFQNLLKPYEATPVSTQAIADRIQAVIDKKPEQAAILEPLVDKYRGQTMTLGELNARRPDVSGVEATGIRDVLYGELGRLNPGENVAGLKQSQSAILTIQKAAQDRIDSLITPDATVKARPLGQRITNAAVSMHVTRPATIPLAIQRLLKPKLASDVPNSQVKSAMGKMSE